MAVAVFLLEFNLASWRYFIEEGLMLNFLLILSSYMMMQNLKMKLSDAKFKIKLSIVRWLGIEVILRMNNDDRYADDWEIK